MGEVMNGRGEVVCYGDGITTPRQAWRGKRSQAEEYKCYLDIELGARNDGSPADRAR